VELPLGLELNRLQPDRDPLIFDCGIDEESCLKVILPSKLEGLLFASRIRIRALGQLFWII
jgi:hypothetical protein